MVDDTSSSKIHPFDLILTGVNRFSLTVTMANTILRKCQTGTVERS